MTRLAQYDLSPVMAVRQHQTAVLTDPAVVAAEAEMNARQAEHTALQGDVEQAREALKRAEAAVAAKWREVGGAMKKFAKAQHKAAKRIDREGA